MRKSKNFLKTTDFQPFFGMKKLHGLYLPTKFSIQDHVQYKSESETASFHGAGQPAGNRHGLGAKLPQQSVYRPQRRFYEQ
jgi:hypothetical protein